jgi:predicted peptidase
MQMPLNVKPAGEMDNALTVTYHIMRRFMSQYPMDPDRIYIVGISSGGNAAWELAGRQKDQ